MLRGRNILIFADDWGLHSSTPQHLAKILMSENRILWVNSFGFRSPQFTRGDAKRIWKKILAMTKPSADKRGQSNFRALHPFVFPYYDIKVVRAINDRLLRWQIQRAMKRFSFDRPVILAAHPLVAALLGTLGESSSHYLCLDDYPSLPGAYASARELEREVLERADTVFAVSEQLRDDRVPRTGNSYFLPQGVDLEHFSVATGRPVAPMGDLLRPIVGFHGLVSEWIDVELIAQAAKTYPQMTFVIVGRVVVDVSTLQGLPNVRMFDHVPYGALPAYVQSFDVGLIPFKINQLTIACNPLKLIEYLALEVPVVSTDLPEVRRFSPIVDVAADSGEFISLIPEAISRGSDLQRTERRRTAERYSWRSVTAGMSDTIERTETKKHRDEKSDAHEGS